MSATGPGISMLMPVYNGGEYMMQAVETALAQMGQDDELIVQDGASKDGSIERLLEHFADRPHLRIVSEPDHGQADALNKALSRASKPVMGWLNADDLLSPGALDAVRGAWRNAPDAGVAYGSFDVIDAEGTVMRTAQPGQFDLNHLIWRPALFSGAIFWSTELVRRLGGFDASLHMCMDVDLVLRVAADRPKVVRLPETLAAFRWHDASKTGTNDFTVVREAYQCYRRYAHGLPGQVLALGAAGRMLAIWWSTPLRMSGPVTRWRLSRAARREPAPTGATP